MITIRHLNWLRSAKPTEEGYSSRLFEMFQDLKNATGNIEQQTNSDASGTPAAPPGIQSVTVTPTPVGHHVSINHGAEFYRGLYYHVESSDNSHFTNPFPEYSGPAREINLATGPRNLHFRVFASYQNSANSPAVYHGPVVGGTAFRGTLQSQGSGTGRPGEGHSGFGNVPFRGSKPPVRGTTS